MLLMYTLCASQEEAETIAKALVAEKAACCVNILPSVTSVYHWQGKVEQAKGEIPVFIKTMAEKQEQVTAIINQLHSYEVPPVLSWPMESLNTDYTKWMQESLGLAT